MGEMLASAKLRTMPDRGPVTPEQIEEARNGNVVVLAEPNENVVSALVKLDAFVDAYLLVTRLVDPAGPGAPAGTHDAVSEYQRLSQNRGEIQLTFAALYVVVAMLILLGAVWLALWAANRIVTPIGRLAGAAERVSEGDLRVRVEVSRDDDEIARCPSLQPHDLAARSASARNWSTPTTNSIRAAASPKRCWPASPPASSAWTAKGDHADQPRGGASAEFDAGRYRRTSLFRIRAGARRPDPPRHERAAGSRSGAGGSEARRRAAASERAGLERGGRQTHGFVVTFDDITDLVSAQRTAAWADVARRIAHEIKNPLTPIQLSAERLKRKYADEVSSDPEVFAQCTDTIIRQVGDIGRMVDEFSSFARMPAPVIRTEKAQELVRHAVFLQRVAQPQIAFEVTAPTEPIKFECDGRLVSQALTNVLKNAVRSDRRARRRAIRRPGRIAIDVRR